MIKKIFNAFKKHKDKPAFCFDNKIFSYKVLGSMIAGIQNLLKETGNQPLVGIVANSDVETYAAVFACLFSNKGFVIINPDNPVSRNEDVIEQSAIHFILTSNPNFLLPQNVQLIDTSNAASNHTLNFDEPQPENIAYILFTSGSTGKPKGVPISVKNLSAFLESFVALPFEINAQDKFLQMFDLTFDVSVATTLIPALYGASVYPVSGKQVKYLEVYRLLEEEEISFATVVPSVLGLLKPYFSDIHLEKLKYCVVTAEASHQELLTQWQKCVPNTEIWNLYGPTEATIWCTAYHWIAENSEIYNGMIPIGKALKNVENVIIDKHKNIVSQGEKGELCLTGHQITEGYLNNETRNRESFIRINDKKFYKTGDLTFVNSEGDIMYCGRMDHQVQIQGFRVELGEIEYHARMFCGLNNVAAIPKKNSDGYYEIYLFLDKYKGEIKDVKAYLKKNLPDYMVPSHIEILENMPLTKSDKIDRKKLVEFLNQ